MSNNFFGAKAIVYLEYVGEISELAEILSKELELPEIYLETDTEPPHELYGMTETLGFEIWLNQSNHVEGFNYLIKFESTMEVKDRFENEMYDLSFWFSKEIARRCNIETFSQLDS